MLIKDLSQAGRVIAPEESRRFKSGVVILPPGENVGEHVTQDREELIIVLEGEATVNDEDVESRVKAGMLAYIGPDRRHDVRNDSDTMLRYVYIVTPIGGR